MEEIMLALNGGSSIRDITANPWPSWPQWGSEEEKALLEVLHSGQWSYNGPKELAFLEAWSSFVGVEHSVLVANGTVSLQLALEALDLGPGDEVIVPGLTWQATAASVIDINAVPVLVDVEPDSWCVSPEAVEAAITPRTRAIVPVHLYGAMVDMDEILRIAGAHDLFVVEDAAHKHGASWNGKRAGSLGHIGSFSLQLSKVLTAGEGGILTTDSDELWERLDALRNCGRRPSQATQASDNKQQGNYGTEGDLVQSGNYRATDFQAAILLEALKRLPEQNKRRAENAEYLNAKLRDGTGVAPLREDPRETERAYFNFAFRYSREAFDDVPVSRFRDALAAELHIDVQPCYEPLTICPLYRPHTKKRYHYSEEYWNAIDPKRYQLPVSERIYNEESVNFHHTLLMGERADMDQVIEAIEKIRHNLSSLKEG
jgi:L-glutamine:2-deoxy-scyllo-inosose/3-amino-2,3-dideoxy-scyllo-inosose aminotransferase